uniref:Uncharacterized protein n=1 Tax=Ditylenchus dipsaci TaxID=166011 RepID=A0A915CTR6_9BILA
MVPKWLWEFEFAASDLAPGSVGANSRPDLAPGSHDSNLALRIWLIAPRGKKFRSGSGSGSQPERSQSGGGSGCQHSYAFGEQDHPLRPNLLQTSVNQHCKGHLVIIKDWLYSALCFAEVSQRNDLDSIYIFVEPLNVFIG